MKIIKKLKGISIATAAIMMISVAIPYSNASAKKSHRMNSEGTLCKDQDDSHRLENLKKDTEEHQLQRLYQV
ncbi:hypothetical protein BVG16_08840 [Paenibacillus selenitireducens]|uniref:Uncharacterized protein n=1 Tax=Paenibacillus selenitireducens TaxID=1324314 RepID=A0A1T2XHC3_9BACL|nr:hypothetical protein [Paenibacillus selenitireducens]OPA79192.1 hypothetical protein BVG16_08840 [Paenibacillus selenitireducens]